LKTSVYVFVLIAVVLVCIALLFLVFLLTGRGGSREDTATTTQGPAMEAGTQLASAAAAQEAAISETTNTQTQLTVTSSSNSNEEAQNKKEHANRKYLMVLGILVASVTYQAGLEPPGGAWESSSGWHEAGNPVMHDNRRPRYLAFFYSNSTSFMASIVVILLLLIPPENLIGTAGNKEWRKKWLVVMNTTIVLDLLGLLGAYAAGSSRRWKTSVYVLLLVIGVLVYMAFHLVLSCIIGKRSKSTQPLLTESPSPAKPEEIAHDAV